MNVWNDLLSFIKNQNALKFISSFLTLFWFSTVSVFITNYKTTIFLLILQIFSAFSFCGYDIFQEDCDPEQPDLLYNNVIPCVFGDINGLKEKSKEWQIRSSRKGEEEPIGLSKKLNDIICRLVTDYRAIFAIEVEFSRSFEK